MSGVRVERPMPWGRRLPRLRFEGDAPLAKAIALGNDDLCLLAPDRRLYCVHGPQGDASAPIDRTPLRLHVAMDDVDEVGLADGVGCARRGGRVECWGPLVRNGWVVRRDRPVRVEGLRGVTSLVALEGYVCAESPGDFRCWGRSLRGTPQPTPARLVAEGAAAESEYDDREALYARRTIDGTSCDDCPAGRNVDPPCAIPCRRGGRLACAVEANGTVSCGDAEDPAAGRARVARLDDVAQVVVTAYGLACALRRDGDVMCWGDNRSGALTAAEAARRPRVVTIAR